MNPKNFNPGDLVDVVNLGSAWPGRYPASVVGVYARDAYIVQWEGQSPFPDDPWPCRVFIRACLAPREVDVKAA